jgi:hypothetical protein
VVGMNDWQEKPKYSEKSYPSAAQSATDSTWPEVDIAISKANSCKYLRIILRRDWSWADQVNYIVKRARKALHFTMRILKKGNSNTKGLAFTSLVGPVLEYASSCWDPYGRTNALDRVQNKAAKSAHQRNYLNWETLAQHRKIARICALFKAYTGEPAWKDIGG